MAMYKKDIEAVYDSNIDDWITDSHNEDNKKLLSNPKLPRVLCIRCFRNILLDKSMKTLKISIGEVKL